MWHYLLLTSALLLAPCAWLVALPAQVIIMRHAEKPPSGVDLSTKGKERAAALVPFFQNTPELLHYGGAAAIYAAAAPKESSSKRSIQTVQGLADALKIPVSDRYEVDDYKAMVEEIKTNPAYVGKMVMICWEHHVIAEIARAFGVLQAPARWPGEVFDRTWVITFQSMGRPTFQNLPQRLMFGDSPH